MNNDVNLLHTIDDDITFEKVRHMPRRTQFVSRHQKLTWQHDRELKKHERDRKLSDAEMSRAHVLMTEKLNRLQDEQKKMARRKSDPWATAIGTTPLGTNNKYRSSIHTPLHQIPSSNLQIRTLAPSIRTTNGKRKNLTHSLSSSTSFKTGTPALSTRPAGTDRMSVHHSLSCVVPEVTAELTPKLKSNDTKHVKMARPKKVVVARVPNMQL